MTETPSSPEGEPTVPTPDHTSAYDAAPVDDGGYPAAETLTEQKTGARRGVVIGVGAAVLAVIAAAGVYATTALSGGGRQPDDLAPKSTFAYGKLDLDPAANQKLAAREFFGKFPKLKKPSGDANVFDTLLEQMFEGEDLSYQTDVKPWFDKRAAVAAFKGTSGEPSVVGIVQSKDDAKAKAAMDKAVAQAKEDGGDFAYKIDDGYVVIGETQADVDDAIAQADKGTIDDNPTFAEDLDRLDGDQIAVGWVDVKEAFNVIKTQLPDAGLIPNAITDQISGRVVSGLHMEGDYVEVSGFIIGAQQGTTPPQAGEAKLLKDLPADTVAALSVNGLGEGLKNGLSQLGAVGMDPQEFIQPFLGELGLNLENDILPLLGDQTVITLGGIPMGVEDISAGLVSTVKDPAGAKTNGTKLAQAISQMGIEVQTDVAGNTFYLATGDYLGELKSSHGLGGVEKFTKATGDLGSVTAALYVDLESVLGQFGPDAQADAGALKSVGLTAGYDGSVPYFRLRVVAL